MIKSANVKLNKIYTLLSVNQFSSVAQSCPTLCDPMNRSTPGLPVHHKLPEFKKKKILKPKIRLKADDQSVQRLYDSV